MRSRSSPFARTKHTISFRISFCRENPPMSPQVILGFLTS